MKKNKKKKIPCKWMNTIDQIPETTHFLFFFFLDTVVNKHWEKLTDE